MSVMNRRELLNWQHYADKVLGGECLTHEEGLSILRSNDQELLSLLDAAYQVRYHYYGNKVKLNMILNAKSGYCPEDCGYCSQSSISKAPIEKYTMLNKDAIVKGAKEAVSRKAGTYCIVASGRGPTDRELNEVLGAVAEIKQNYQLKICTCLGILKEGQADQLKQAGVDRYNHNLNTSEDHFDQITRTHTYADRVHTVEETKIAGISPCSGCIVGMGETHEQLVDLALSLRALDADSIPINFLNSIHGTPLEDMKQLNPRYCLKVLALFRFICPDKEIRVAGGRELNLGHLQPLSLYAANSLFVGDYLTTDGQAISNDHQMIEELGFEIEESCV